jgi:thioredoxin 1
VTTPTAHLTHPIGVTDEDFTAQVLRSEQPVLVDFGADWCPPCRAMEPTVAALAQEYAGRVRFAALNTDDNPRTAMRYGVMGLPTFILFRGGNEVARLVGAHPKAALKRAIDGVVGAAG